MVKEGRVIRFLKLVETYLQDPAVIKCAVFVDEVKQMASAVENQDLFVLSFIAWMRSRITSETPYQALLALLEERKQQ